MSALYEQFNPFRNPAWRCRRVLELVDASPVRRAHRVHDDEYVKKFRLFMLSLKAAQTESARLRLFHREPGIYYANQFYNHPDSGWRAILDARILAREPDDFIADEFDTIPEAIYWYEKLFFNVRDRLHSRSYIVKSVLGIGQGAVTDAEGSITTEQQAMAYKLFAYFGGPMVLDVLLFGCEGRSMPTKVDQAEEWLDESVKSAIRIKSAVTARFMSINKFSMLQLLEIQQRFMQFEKEARLAAGGAGADYQANIERFFEQIPLAIGSAAKKGRTQASLYFDETSAEPRAVEDLHLVRGEVPDSLRQKLEYVRPEPSNGEGVLTDAGSKTDG